MRRLLTVADLPDPARFATFHPFIKGVFSQWHVTPFTVNGSTVNTAEQWMMVSKARLFGDDAVAAAILATPDPAEQKRLGARVSQFDQVQWDLHRFSIVYDGNRAKFEQNAGALRQLLNTAPAMLVEANPRDWNWGNGLQIEDPANNDPSQWAGTNFLGRILTKVRQDIAEAG